MRTVLYPNQEEGPRRRPGRPKNSPARDARTRQERELWAGRVRQLRELLGETQAELARRIGVHTLTVSSWERALTAPRAEIRSAILALLAGDDGPQS